MDSRDLNILALPEPTKAVFQRRIDEIGAGLHRRFEALLPDKLPYDEMERIHYLLCRWEGSAIDFENGIDMNFGLWQSRMELIYNDINQALSDAEKTVKKKGGETK